MQLKLRHWFAVLSLLVSAACADSPTAPTASADDARQREHVTYYPGTTYDGTPSEVDRKTSVNLGNHFGLGRPLPGYIIDKDGYYRYDGHGNTATPRRARCGY